MWPNLRRPPPPKPGALRRRLYRRLGAALIVLLGLLGTLAWRYANTASERAFDHLLSASALTLAEGFRLEGNALRADVPPSAFAMLARLTDDRVFYRLLDDDGRTITGYPDLLPPPAPDARQDASEPQFVTTTYKDVPIRLVAVRRLLTQGERPRWAVTLVAQTLVQRQAQALEMGGYAVLGLLVLAAAAAAMIGLAVTEALRPIVDLKQVIADRDPRDFTPLRQPVPEEIQPLQRALNSLLARFESSLTETRNFLADATHQVRTPLASVITQTEVALRDATPAQQEQLQRILRNARSAARIADQLLTDATIGNRLELSPRTPLALARLCADVINDRLGGAGDTSLRLFIADDTSATAEVLGDRGALADALRNLIDNALKFGPATGPVEIILHSDASYLSVTVRDYGPGIAPEDRPRVLRRFERGSSRLPADRLGGSGLGLAIVQRVVRGHGGQIDLLNADGGGLAVTLRFPHLSEGETQK